MARASSSAVIVVPSGPVRSNVCVASSTKRTSKPTFAPTRAVVSQQWFVVIPQIAIRSRSRPRSHAARSGSPWKAELTCLVTSRSGSPSTSGRNALPGRSGRSGESGSSESWRTKTTGSPASRQAPISRATFASHAGLLRRPQ